MRRLSYAKKWQINPWGREIWGKLAEYNELYGLTEEQLMVCEEYINLELESYEKLYNNMNNEPNSCKSTTISFSPKLLKQLEEEDKNK
jgi:hypothetical protein